MSTSPSWFDQEKFSRLVKKVGSKPAAATPSPDQAASAPASVEKPAPQPSFSPTASQPLPDRPKLTPPGDQSLSSTSRISLVSKPTSLLAEHRALPALPRRTVPLPAIKSFFPGAPAPIRAPTGELPLPSSTDEPQAPDDFTPESAEPVAVETAPAETAPEPPQGDDMAAVWQKITQLNDELARVHQERDVAVNEAHSLRDELRIARENVPGAPAASGEDQSNLIRERDEARAEAEDLREKLAKAEDDLKASPGGGSDLANEVKLLTEERDQSRRDYSKLRADFEMFKQDQAKAPKEDVEKIRRELGLQIDELKKQLDDKTVEITNLKANPLPIGGGGSDEGSSKLKDELASLKDQLAKAKEECSVAQRGLVLSQKALHETRDALREATEGTSLSRHNFDNLKAECATLVQQNTILQAQNEQLMRDLNAAKSKLTTRLG